MTEAEFDAVLTLHGWELRLTGGMEVTMARIVAPIQPDDVSQGPYRYEGMVRVVGEIGAPTRDEAVQMLIKLYEGGHFK